MKKKATRVRVPKVDMHLQAHEEINKKLGYILHEVSANGNPGLDASLKDLYRVQQGVKQRQDEIMDKLNEVYSHIKPTLDFAAWRKQGWHIFKNSRVYWCFNTRLKAIITTITILVCLNVFIHPFFDSTIIVGTIVVLVKKLLGML